MQQQPEQSQFDRDNRFGLNLLYLLLEAHALCLTVFMRHSFGRNRPGITGIFSIFVMFAAMAYFEDIRLFWMLEMWFVVLICHRIRTLYLVSHGWKEHSHYDGYPWLAKLVPCNKTEAQAKSAEPVLCLAIGAAFHAVWPAVGYFIMLGAVSLCAVRWIQFAVRRRQVVAMQDLEIEQRALSERLRGIRKDF